MRRNRPHLLYQQLNKLHYAHNTLPCSLLSVYAVALKAKVGAVDTDVWQFSVHNVWEEGLYMHNFLYVAVYAKVVAIT